MPPWFAMPGCGPFENDPSLTEAEIGVFAAWAARGAPAGDSRDSPPPVHWAEGWNIDHPDVVLTMPKVVPIPADRDIPYTYVVIPTHFSEDKWVTMSEIRPGNRSVVHHAVAYIREANSQWLRGAPVGKAFTADDLVDQKSRRDAMWTTSDLLLVYAPGSSPDHWPDGFGKLVPAGSDIVLQMHYTSQEKPTFDQTSIGLRFLRGPVTKRVLSLQLTNDKFLIPPGDPDHKVEVHGTFPNPALLLSFFPHMHLRGKTFEYDLISTNGSKRTLLRISQYDFFWQLSYRLAQPLTIEGGETLQAIATFDNSKNNSHNPDPEAAVSWGEQTWAEMMVGFFDIAVDPGTDKASYFKRSDHQNPILHKSMQ